MFRAPGPGRGHVVDFVQVPNFPIFNVADSAIVCAAVLIALLAFRGINIDGTRSPGGKHEQHEAQTTPPEQTLPENSAGPDHDV